MDNIEQRIARGEVGFLAGGAEPAQLRAWQQIAVEQSDCGIPLMFTVDVIHGHRTIFPLPIALAGSFDADLIRDTARVAALEASSEGVTLTWAPMLDISRDARWGRCAESPGEDPVLGSMYVRAMVEGFQGSDPSQPGQLLSCAKHFAAYGFADGGRDYNAVDMTPYRLHNVVLPPFEAAVQAGVAAIHLEDQMAPKRCGQLAGIKLIPAEENVRRLKCAIAARPAEGPLIIGRTDAMPAIGPEEAVRRALMYQDAGVDLVFVDGIKKISEVEIVARQVPGPKVVSIVDGNETTALTMRDLEEMGFAVVFYAVTALFSAARAMADALAVLKRDGTPAKAASAMMSYAEFSALVDLPRFQALDETYG